MTSFTKFGTWNIVGKKEFFQEGGFYYQISGHGKPLIFLHGYGVSPLSFAPIIRELSKKFLVIAPYMSSGWKKTNQEKILGFDGLVDLLAKLVDHLKFDKPLIVGYSMGSLPAIKFAIKYPKKTSSLVIADGLSIYPAKKLWQLAKDVLIELTKALFTLKGLKPVLSVYTDFVLNVLLHPLVVINQTRECLKAIPLGQLSSLSKETLILWGREDKILPIGLGQKLRKLLKNSTLKTVNDDHIWGLKNPKAFSQEIVDFVTRKNHLPVS